MILFGGIRTGPRAHSREPGLRGTGLRGHRAARARVPSLYAQLPGLLASWSATDLVGAADTPINTWAPNEVGSVGDNLVISGVGTRALKLTAGPSGGKAVLMTNAQYVLSAAQRSAIVSAQKATVIAVIRVSSSITNGFQNSGTSAFDEHWGLSNTRIYTEFFSDTRTGELYNGAGLTSWHVACITRDGTTTRVFINTTKIYEGTVGAWAAAATIGALGVTSGGSLYVEGCGWYASSPSTAAIQATIAAVRAAKGV